VRPGGAPDYDDWRFSMFFLTPLGSAAVLAGIGVASYEAATNEESDYRFGWTDEGGKVPIWGDYRLWAAGLGYLASMFGPFQLRGVGQVAMLSGLASFTATEAMAASETGQLFGFDIGGLLPAGDEAVPAGDEAATTDE